MRREDKSVPTAQLLRLHSLPRLQFEKCHPEPRANNHANGVPHPIARCHMAAAVPSRDGHDNSVPTGAARPG